MYCTGGGDGFRTGAGAGVGGCLVGMEGRVEVGLERGGGWLVRVAFTLLIWVGTANAFFTPT